MRGNVLGVAGDRGWKVVCHVDPRCDMHFCGISVTWLLVLQASWTFQLILGAGFAGNPALNDPGQNYTSYGGLGQKRGRSDDFLGAGQRPIKWTKGNGGSGRVTTLNSSGGSPVGHVGSDDLEAYERRSYTSGSPVPFQRYIPVDYSPQEDSCSSEGEEDSEMVDYEVSAHTAPSFPDTNN